MGKKAFVICSILVLIILLLLRCSRQPPTSEGTLGVGLEAPPFELSDLQGQQVSLDGYRGKIVMLDFWATWCGPCRLSMPLLEKLQEEYPADVALLAINLQEDPEIVHRYIERNRLRKTTVLLDQEGTVGHLYGTDSIPKQVLIDREGIVRHIQVGFSPRMGDLLRGEIDKLR